MTQIFMTMLLILGMLPALTSALTPAASPLAGDGSTPVAYSCPVTTPTDERPPATIDPFAIDDAIHGSNGLWVTIPEDGVLTLTADDEIEALSLIGWRSTTFTWMRAEDVEGFVVVSGERLDEDSELSPQTPLSPQRQYTMVGYVQTGIAFPSAGCWEVTGTVASPLVGNDHSITWVMDVRFVDEPVATPHL